jgi:TonB family protein
MSLLTTPPTAEPSEPQPKEIPAEPAETNAPPLNPAPTLKTNMVAREVRVLATALPHDKNAIERELFTEETDSVLVHENGGVIRLSLDVAHGQLLLLTNVELKREVVAQVKRKRVYQRTTCFAELEFVEPAPRFWGLEFSAATALLPRAAEDAAVAALVTSAESTADDPGEPPRAPTAEDAHAFQREVEVLRGRPKLTEAPAESLEGSAEVQVPVPPAFPEASSALTVGGEPGTEFSSSSGSRDASGGAITGNSLLVEHKTDPVEWTAEDQAQLPKPSLDFSISLPKTKGSLRARGSFTPKFRGGVMRLALLTAALVVTTVGAAWYKHWMPWQSRAKKVADQSEFNNARVASDAPVTSAGMPFPSAALPTTVPPEPKDLTESPSRPFGSSVSGAHPTVRKTSPSAALAMRRSPDRTTAKATPDSIAPSVSESTIVPPKLIKSVRAVASLEALRDFETGNVVIDAVVGTAGEVNFISVLSGPPSLRPAAVESLKQFQYEPATRNGQPVPAHVTITIHFRFER